MIIKRIKKLRVSSIVHTVIWDNTLDCGCGSLNYRKRIINIGVKNNDDNELFGVICHELWEMVAIENSVRLTRPDCYSDYIFVYDHRQHTTMANMFAGLLTQFIK